ncbi:hypothetical protein D3C83_182390 [compost metagenome]
MCFSSFLTSMPRWKRPISHGKVPPPCGSITSSAGKASITPPNMSEPAAMPFSYGLPQRLRRKCLSMRSPPHG